MNISASDFDYIRSTVLRHAAISLEPGKEYLVESRLAPIMRAENLDSFATLVSAMRRPGESRLLGLVIDAMTTNETSFFRDSHPWVALREELLPALIDARRSVRRLNLWCAASSSGQEPFSLAMLIHEHFPEVARDWTVRISGVDLSPTMVRKSNEGRFSQLEVNRGLPASMLMKYFTRSGKDWQVIDDVLRMVDFSEGNLIDPRMWARVPLVDGIFIRNVLIYFDQATRRGILDRAHGRLRSDGFLMLGSSETAVGLDSSYERVQVGKTVTFRPVPAENTRLALQT